MTESERLIRTLYRISSEHHKGLAHQTAQLLQLGRERFGLEIGILSKIDGDSYLIVHRSCPPEIPLQEGDRFPLGNTYCNITLSANGPVGFEHVGESEINTHPAYREFALECYIGTPVMVNDALYGTLNFSSPKPLRRRFRSIDIDALQLMASWLSSELARTQRESQLALAEERFRLGLEASPGAMIMVNREGGISYANREAERLFKFSRAELTGQPVELLLPESIRAKHPGLRNAFFDNPMVRAMGTGRDLLARDSTGKVFPVEIGLNPIETTEGTVVLCAVMDLTERKRNERKIQEQADQLQQANSILAELARTDSLTNIANRRFLTNEMEMTLTRAHRSEQPTSLLLADIDHFKRYNDSYGHPAGDRALQRVAEVLTAAVRGSDFVARYGGEEFVALLPATGKTGARKIAERIRRQVEAITDLECDITVSIGIATLKSDKLCPDDTGGSGERLIEQADKALYRSKENGRNRSTHFDGIKG